MIYRFYCLWCGNEEDKEIPISEYDNLKDKMICSCCLREMKRKIEWTGIATGSGEGWCGKKGGNSI